MRLNIVDDKAVVSDILVINNGGETLCQSDPTSADTPSPSGSLSFLSLPLTGRQLALQVN